MYLLILRYVLPGFLVAAAIAWAFGTVYSNGYDNGVNAANAVQHELEVKRQSAIKHVVDQVEKKEDENVKLVARIQDQNIKDIFNINRVATDLRNRGLYVPAQDTCPRSSSGAGKETDDIEGAGGGAGRTRLPEAVEHFLIARLEAADQVVAQYDACRSLLKDLTFQN